MRRALLAAALLLCASGARSGAQTTAVDAVSLTVADLQRSRAFYTEALDCTVEGEVEVSGRAWEALRGVAPLRMRVARLRLGAEHLELVEYRTPPGRPAPADARSNDRWFQHAAIVVADMDRAAARLQAHGVVPISTAPQRLPDWNPDAGGIRAWYFRDPDGHPLELIWFPPGRGDPRWQAPGAALFRGIDHTAIAVADTEASLAFYRDRLGLRVAGGSENWGPEQDGLNGIPGSRVRITGCAPRADRASSCWSMSRPARGGPIRPTHTPTICCGGRPGSWSRSTRCGCPPWTRPGTSWASTAAPPFATRTVTPWSSSSRSVASRGCHPRQRGQTRRVRRTRRAGARSG
ncbi:MAG: VOC family protein [Candidatus Binatia bacterium]